MDFTVFKGSDGTAQRGAKLKVVHVPCSQDGMARGRVSENELLFPHLTGSKDIDLRPGSRLPLSPGLTKILPCVSLISDIFLLREGSVF